MSIPFQQIKSDAGIEAEQSTRFPMGSSHRTLAQGSGKKYFY
jgi:hypothetical protein